MRAVYPGKSLVQPSTAQDSGCHLHLQVRTSRLLSCWPWQAGGTQWLLLSGKQLTAPLPAQSISHLIPRRVDRTEPCYARVAFGCPSRAPESAS